MYNPELGLVGKILTSSVGQYFSWSDLVHCRVGGTLRKSGNGLGCRSLNELHLAATGFGSYRRHDGVKLWSRDFGIYRRHDGVKLWRWLRPHHESTREIARRSGLSVKVGGSK